MKTFFKTTIFILIILSIHIYGVYKAQYRLHTKQLNEIFSAPDWYGSCPLLHSNWVRECDGTIHPMYDWRGRLWQK